ncbi:Biotin transporter BioY [bioreactor metagenome]|uniref:Biotin transporter BioY n=1 Tax=bioreactor metagenome TaxID=1076179 RepID=A0A645C027_9ZZZZ
MPFTLQTFFVALAGLLLGKKLGAVSALVYMAIGLIGIPVFTEGGGIAYVLKPTFGYIVGFALGAYVTGAIARKVETPSLGRLIAAVFAGFGVTYLLGMTYFYFMSNFYLGKAIGVGTVLLYCFLVFVPGNGVMGVIAALVAKRMIPVLNKNQL